MTLSPQKMSHHMREACVTRLVCVYIYIYIKAYKICFIILNNK